MIGAYAAAAFDGCQEETTKQFTAYVTKARVKGILPGWWDATSERELWEIASTDIHFAIEKSDVIKEFGYESGEHMVLRSLAAAIIGTKVDGPS